MNPEGNAARPASPEDPDQKSTSTEDSGQAGIISACNVVKLRIQLVREDIVHAVDSAIELLNNLQAFPPEARLVDSIQRLDDLIPRLRTAIVLTVELLALVNAQNPPAAN